MDWVRKSPKANTWLSGQLPASQANRSAIWKIGQREESATKGGYLGFKKRSWNGPDGKNGWHGILLRLKQVKRESGTFGTHTLA